MCANDFAADDIGWGLLVRRGVVSNAYLWRSGQVRGYAVVIYTGRHVAEPTELDEGEAASFWRDVLALARAVEAFYEPLKMNYLLLGNQIPHAHWHCVPRREAGTDPGSGWAAALRGARSRAPGRAAGAGGCPSAASAAG
ncbi:HIT family protein [Streptomyces sp. NPDC002611]